MCKLLHTFIIDTVEKVVTGKFTGDVFGFSPIPMTSKRPLDVYELLDFLARDGSFDNVHASSTIH